ncbi:MAG TPA: CrcB family protein [Candidatus Paceibacterota bacterium]|nr:CrcB family protein [Candidatus Paceibacterota bacterium]
MGLGGIAGSLVRWTLSVEFDQTRVGTLVANLIGVALAAFFLVLMERHGTDALRHLLLPGFCGGLTTFSAFAYQSVEPSSGGVGYIIQTLLLSLLVIAVVIPLSRKVVPERA